MNGRENKACCANSPIIPPCTNHISGFDACAHSGWGLLNDTLSPAVNLKSHVQEMQDVPDGQRACRFRCVLALVGQGIEETFSGACEGTLLHRRRGDGGFGYDPLFLPNKSEHTFAEIGLDEKAKISHRARALTKLIDWLKNR